MTERTVMKQQQREERLKLRTASIGNGADSDIDSIATDSTVISEYDADKEYEVEQILAERKKGGEQQYLIKWAGYPEERASFEPEDCILDKSIIQSWRVTLADQKAGKLAAFDVAAWEAKMKRLAKEKEERKARRKDKRRNRARKNINAGLTSDDSDDEPLHFRKLRRPDRSCQTSDDDDVPLASLTRKPSMDKQPKKKKEKAKESENEGSGSEDSLMADLSRKEARRKARGTREHASKTIGGEVGDKTKTQRRRSEGKNTLRRAADSPNAGSPVLGNRDLPRVSSAKVAPPSRTGSRDSTQETARPNVMSTGYQGTARVPSAVSSAPTGPRPRGRPRGSGRGGATRGGSSGLGTTRRGALPSTSNVFSRSERPKMGKKNLSSALGASIGGEQAPDLTNQPKISKNLSHQRKLELAGRAKEDGAVDLAVVGGLINPAEIKDSRTAYQQLKPRENRPPDGQNRQTSGSDVVPVTSAPPSRRSSTTRVRFMDDNNEGPGQIFEEPSPIVQNQDLQDRGVGGSPPTAQMVIERGMDQHQPDVPGQGKMGNSNIRPKPILRAPSGPTPSNDWSFHPPPMPRAETMPISNQTSLPSNSHEPVRPALDRRTSTGERKKVSLSEYNARQGVERSGHLVKKAIFGASNTNPVLISFNGIARSSQEPWVKEISSLEAINFAHACTASDFQAQSPFVNAKVLGHGFIAANADAAVTLDRTAEHLRLRLGGLIFNHLSTAILVYPTRLDEWKFLEKVEVLHSPATLRYHIFELPQFCPIIDSPSAGIVSSTAVPSPPYWAAAMEFFCSLNYDSLLPPLPPPVKGQEKRKEQDRDNFFLLIPENANPSPQFLTTWLKSCKPSCKVLTSLKAGSWSAFIDHARKEKSAGTVIIHESLIPQIPKLPKLQRLFWGRCNFAIFSINSCPVPRRLSLEDPVPTAMVRTRLFPLGAAFFLAPSIILADPKNVLKFLRWFAAEQEIRTPGTYKLLGCHGMREFMLDVAIEKATERANIIAQAKGRDVEPEAIKKGLGIDSNTFRFEMYALIDAMMEKEDETLPPYYDLEDLEDEDRLIIYASDLITEDNESELLLWFAAWSITNVHKYKRFWVVGTDPSNVHKAVRSPPAQKTTETTVAEIAPLMKIASPSSPFEHSVRWKKTGFTAVTEVVPAPLFSTVAAVSRPSLVDDSISPLTRSPDMDQAAKAEEILPSSDVDTDMNLNAKETDHADEPTTQQWGNLWELERKISEFMAITGCDDNDQASDCLAMVNADVDSAVKLYRKNSLHAVPTAPAQMPVSPPPPPFPTQLDGPSSPNVASRPESRSGVVTEENGRRIVPSSTRGNGTTRPEIGIRTGYLAKEDKEVWRSPSAVLSMLPRNVRQNATGHVTDSRQRRIVSTTDESGDVIMSDVNQNELSLQPPEAKADERLGSGSSGIYERSSSRSSPTKKDTSRNRSKATTELWKREEMIGRGWNHVKIMGIQEAIEARRYN